MSHDATNWAIKVKGLKPIARIVLWHLADCHNPSMGCFPSQEYLAEHCEISRASVNRCLDDLEQRSLLRRQARVHPDTKRQLPTRYFLACEKDFHAQDVASRVSGLDTGPALESGAQVGGPAVENSESRVSKTGGAVSHSSETLTFKEPINPPPPSVTDFASMVAYWPQDRRGTDAKIARAFDRLDPTEQRQAIETTKAYRLGLILLKRPLPALPSYLREKLFLEFIGAPPIERGGFRIEKGTAEWDAWRAHHAAGRDTGTPTFLNRLDAQGYVIEPSRWPVAPRSHHYHQKIDEEEDA